jgi:hypothetical protein
MKGSIISVAMLLTFCCSCREAKEKLLPSFTVNIPAIKLTVPPLPVVVKEPVPVGALKTHINMDSSIRANTNNVLGADAVDFVKVKKLVIRALNADKKNNLSNFESARMTIFSDTSSTDIAVISFPTTYSDSITVIPQKSPDISKYLRGTTLAYNLYWTNRKITTKFLKLEVNVTVGVQ